jgi:hypothetical protein
MPSHGCRQRHRQKARRCIDEITRLSPQKRSPVVKQPRCPTWGSALFVWVTDHAPSIRFGFSTNLIASSLASTVIVRTTILHASTLNSSSLRLRALASKFGAMRSRCPAALVLRLGTTAWHFPSSPTEPRLLRESQHFGEPDVDTWRAALLMVKRYGDRAAFEGAMRADLALAEGDVDVAAAWRRILDALDRLQAKAPADGEKVH